MTEKQEFIPAEDLSSAERIATMNGYRARIREGDIPNKEELTYALDLLRTERSVSAGRTAAKKEAKAPAKPISLDEL